MGVAAPKLLNWYMYILYEYLPLLGVIRKKKKMPTKELRQC